MTDKEMLLHLEKRLRILMRHSEEAHCSNYALDTAIAATMMTISWLQGLVAFNEQAVITEQEKC